MDDAALYDSIRAKVYAKLADDPTAADAPVYRSILAKLPKVNVGPADIKPDENPSGPLVKLPGEHSMLEVKIPGLDIPESATALDVMDPRTKGLQALNEVVPGLRTVAAGFGVGGALAGAAGEAVPALARSVGGRILGSAAEGAVGSGGVSAMDAASRGQSAGEVARAGAGGALMGGAVGAGAQTVGEMLAGAGRAALSTKGAAARKLIEKYGGKVGALDSGSGLPELDAQQGAVTPADVGALAKESGKKLIAANDARFHQEGRLPYQKEIARIEGRSLPDTGGVPSPVEGEPQTKVIKNQRMSEIVPPSQGGMPVGMTDAERAALPDNTASLDKTQRIDMGSTPETKSAMAGDDAVLPPGLRYQDVTPLRNKMLEVAQDKSTDPATQAFLRKQASIIAKENAHSSGLYLMTEQDLNGLKSMLQNASNPGLPPGAGSVRDVKVGLVAAEAKRLVDQGPYGAPNAAYAAAKNASGDFRESMGLGRKPARSEAVDEGKAARFLMRQGQSTAAAGIQGADPRLADLVAQHPELQRTVDAPRLLQAKGDLQFGLTPGMATHGATIGAARFAAHNASALAGRVGYGPAQAAVGARDALSQGVNPLVAAAQQSQQAQAEEQQRQQALQLRMRDAHVIHTIFGKPRDENQQ
ncbi:MAG TPA: hypothetical protein VN877_01815, partial [Opitutaceae bacterium]|nr:hypothetical protein [Opitutaceae bacterium]